MQERLEQTCEMTGDPCLRLGVLEERVAGLVRAGDGRESRLVGLEAKVGDLHEALGRLREEMAEKLADVRDSGWRQFWLLAALLVSTVLGLAIYLSQMLVTHIVQP